VEAAARVCAALAWGIRAQRAAGATLRRPGHLGRACPGRKAGEKSGWILLRKRGKREEGDGADRWGYSVSGTERLTACEVCGA